MIEHHKSFCDVSGFGRPALLPDWEMLWQTLPVVEVDGPWLWTTGTEWHTDAGGPWSALLVIENDGMRVEHLTDSVEPAPGDLLFFDISQEHRAVPLKERAFMLCLFADFGERLAPTEAYRAILGKLEAEQRFHNWQRHILDNEERLR